MVVPIGRRLVWLSVIILLLLSALGARLYNVEVSKSRLYTQVAYDAQTLSVPLVEKRGQILDRNGVPLTAPKTAWGLAVFPPLLADRQAESVALAVTLGTSRAAVEAALPGQTAGWAGLPDLTPAQASAVQQLGLPGVAVGDRELERYGDGALARHLVGYVNVKSGGVKGLEMAYNQELAGNAVPSLTATVDGRNQPLAGLGIRTGLSTVGKAPYQLVTTIDQRIQQAVERVLDSQRSPDGGPLRAAAVVLDPGTGEVLAMASRPAFDYGTLNGVLNSDEAIQKLYLTNRSVAAYPPGSVFKAVIAAAALEKNLVKPDEKFYCDGHYDVGGATVTEPGGGHGWITFQEAVAKSCNITFLKVGIERLGGQAMHDMAVQFGFGTETGALGRPWPDEQAGAVPGTDDPSAVQMAIGQGALAVTPLQIARAYAAIANGGTLPAVQLVKAVKSPAGEVIERPAAGRPERVISEETAATLRSLLAGVTDPGGVGTGARAWIPGVGSAGKTGSAETGVKDAAGHQIVHAWFAGYFPERQPRYVVAVLVENGQAGGAVAAPIFQQIGKAILAITGY